MEAKVTALAAMVQRSVSMCASKRQAIFAVPLDMSLLTAKDRLFLLDFFQLLVGMLSLRMVLSIQRAFWFVAGTSEQIGESFVSQIAPSRFTTLDETHIRIGNAMKAKKEELIDFLEQNVLQPGESHPEATATIKKKIRCTRMRLNNLNSAEKVEEFFWHAMASDRGIDSYTQITRIGATTFEDVRAEFKTLCSR